MNSVLLQPAAFLAMAYGGMLTGFVLDLTRIPRRLISGRAVTWIADGVFVLLSALIAALSLIFATGGSLRPYCAAGILLGFFLEQISISHLFFRFFHRIRAKFRN